MFILKEGRTTPCCPYCSYYDHAGHATDCPAGVLEAELKAALVNAAELAHERDNIDFQRTQWKQRAEASEKERNEARAGADAAMVVAKAEVAECKVAEKKLEALRGAVAAEREACVKIAEDWRHDPRQIAAAIRARSGALNDGGGK